MIFLSRILEIKQQMVEETGELVKEQRKLFTSRFDEEKGYLFWNMKSHNKIYSDITFPECFTYADQGRLQKLSRYIYSNTNMLGYRGNGGAKPYSKYKIGELIELKKSALSEFMKKCKDYEIIKEVRIESNNFVEVQYYMNPIYYFSSKRIPLSLYLIFRNSLDEHLNDWVKNEFNRVENEQNDIEGD